MFKDSILSIKTLIILLFFLYLFLPKVLGMELGPDDIALNQYYSIVTYEGDLLATTRYRPLVGDEYLTVDNHLYQIKQVEDLVAKASLKEKIESYSQEVMGSLKAQDEKSIGIFHTHNAESYVPSDGTHSIDGKGGIHAVGQAFADALEKLGVRPIYSEDLHLPHDRGAYRRSRETALEILGEEPDAIFDLHRNAAPYEVYSLHLNGEELTHLQFVVGLLNPHAEVNRSFSYDLKNITNELYPSLVKGVLYTQGGTFNQDLYPTMLLVEVGAHTNPREAAERSMELFAEGVYHYFYGYAGVKEDPEKAKPLMTALFRSLITILLVTIGGGLLFLAINSKDLEDFKEKVSGIIRRGIMGLRRIIQR